MSARRNIVRVSFVEPGGRTDGIEFYEAIAVADNLIRAPLVLEAPSCIANITINQTECIIEGLVASTRYDIYTRSYSSETKFGDRKYLGSFTTGEFKARWELSCF